MSGKRRKEPPADYAEVARTRQQAYAPVQADDEVPEAPPSPYRQPTQPTAPLPQQYQQQPPLPLTPQDQRGTHSHLSSKDSSGRNSLRPTCRTTTTWAQTTVQARCPLRAHREACCLADLLARSYDEYKAFQTRLLAALRPGQMPVDLHVRQELLRGLRDAHRARRPQRLRRGEAARRAGARVAVAAEVRGEPPERDGMLHRGQQRDAAGDGLRAARHERQAPPAERAMRLWL
ncbi:hypothetical protein PF007_g10097 [Phytophthora fragariae]|uniref:Uncharacterized protein n=1 Tax=Phytophthora fragariae TaxID=53985 RepID=A0A6A3TFM2_9STRA|nr:hypothetical protein PF007_g10097 [Phytophthora fragariae]KAE9136235.1 hypothetical protein PF006_g14431 [Phytophthora fragariae]